MGSTTGIAWTDHTFNPWRGCTKVSAGCANCYAATMSKRNPAVLGEWGPDGKRAMAAPSYWRLPARWNREAREAGERRRVFCASLADVFEDRPELVGPRRSLFAAIAATPSLDWLLLTKRPENLARLMPNVPPWNVWLGVSVEDQATADARIQVLLDTPAALRFVSYEPALGAVDLGDKFGRYREIGSGLLPCPDWVIVGGESGPKARPFDIDWARSVVRQCRVAEVPVFVKQMGARPIGPDYGATSEYDEGCRASISLHDRAGADPSEWPEDLRVREFPR